MPSHAEYLELFAETDDPAQIEHYELCRKNGASHRLALMLALGVPPMSNSDREFLQGSENGRQFQNCPHIGNAYAKLAKRAGFTDLSGKKYLSGLARFPGDPEAWVSDRSDVKRVLENRGWGAEGAVTTKVRELDQPPEITPVAPHIVERETQAEVAKTGPVTPKKRREIKEQVRERLTPHWAKKGV